MNASYAAELLTRQDALRAEAGHVLAALSIVSMLAPAGSVTFNGSYVTGLMVWRDLDISVVAPGMTSRQAYETILPLLTHPDVALVRYRNEARARHPAPQPEDDRYFFATYVRVDEQEWKIDISFWVSHLSRAERLSPDSIIPRLTDETRLAILWIKDIWYQRPEYMTTVSSADIYDAVLDAGVRTPDDFEAYLARRAAESR